MRSILGRTGWASLATFFSAAVMAAGLSLVSAPAQAGFELPEGERITNLPHIPRSMPQKEAYELYDPVIGRNFDIKNFWMRADVRVRPEFRNGVCFGGGNPAAGACNSAASTNAALGTKTANGGKAASDQYVQQWVRLGLGYDLSPDVNFYMEIIDSATWGANGNPNNAGNGGDPLNHQCATNASQTGQCRLGVRAAYMLVRNLAGVQGLSMKVGRQYVIFGNHSLFGHFDWANTGYSHDGVMFAYSTKSFESYLGWFRNSEGDLGQGAAVGSGGPNVVGGGVGQNNANADSDMFIFYNQIKSVPGFLIEPYYVYYKNSLPANGTCGAAGTNASCGVSGAGAAAIGGLGAPKHANQTRHMIGNRIEMRKGNWDAINETAYQFGQMGETAATGACANDQKCLHINAWATRNWIGYTAYNMAWKPRLAFNLDYASGDGRSNCVTATNGLQCNKTANTFENFFPTNHIHMAYMDVQAWKNMLAPQANFQARPTTADHFEIWYMHMRLANKQDNWYRGAQGAYIISKQGNTKSHVGDEVDFTWTHMFADGKVALQATYGHMFAGGYIQENLGTSANQSWGFIQLWMNF